MPGSLRQRLTGTAALLLAALVFLHSDADGSDLLPTAEPSAAYRVPIDVVWHQGRLFVANSRTGTVSRIHASPGVVEHEWRVAESISGMAEFRDRLLVLDDRTHRLLCLEAELPTGSLRRCQSLPVASFPVGIRVSPDENVVVTSSLWSRQLTVLQAVSNQQLEVVRVVNLPFAPRCLHFLPNGLLAVADSFGGQLAIVDVTDGRLVHQLRVNGHNIRGLCLNHEGTGLHITHQTLSSDTFISYERVFWGVVMQNGLQTLPLTELMQPTPGSVTSPAATYSGGSLQQSGRSHYPLGTPSIGSGDPAELVLTRNDTTLLLLSGFNQIAFRTASHLPFSRLSTGRRPESICLDTSEQYAFVANRFDDSITVISLTDTQPAVAATIPLGVMRPLTEAEQGERLFHDASLSLDGWYSCHSCHTDGHTNSMLSDTLGDEGQGAPKKVLSLLGSGDTGPWAWNGTKDSLEKQIHVSLIMSMQTQLPGDQLPVTSLAAYLRTLSAAPSVMEARGETLPDEQLRASRHLFEIRGCASCHAGPTLTSAEVYDVGIHDERDGREFNPPSLRGVSQRAPWFHDGRAATLRDVLMSGHHNADAPLNAAELGALESLLNSL